MHFEETLLAGAYVLEIEVHTDERGFFARTFCSEEFEEHRLKPSVAQCSISFNLASGTLRGMHFQRAPHGEERLVRCTRGRIFDVIVDLREGSRTRFHSYAIELSAENRRQLYIPKGFAHGFQTLEESSEVLYQISTPYVPGASQGYHYASPAFAIDWPLPPIHVSQRDEELELLQIQRNSQNSGG